jgi:hypothetical protein
MLIWLVEAHPSVVSASNANAIPFYLFFLRRTSNPTLLDLVDADPCQSYIPQGFVMSLAHHPSLGCSNANHSNEKCNEIRNGILGVGFITELNQEDNLW